MRCFLVRGAVNTRNEIETEKMCNTERDVRSGEVVTQITKVHQAKPELQMCSAALPPSPAQQFNVSPLVLSSVALNGATLDLVLAGGCIMCVMTVSHSPRS